MGADDLLKGRPRRPNNLSGVTPRTTVGHWQIYLVVIVFMELFLIVTHIPGMVMLR